MKLALHLPLRRAFARAWALVAADDHGHHHYAFHGTVLGVMAAALAVKLGLVLVPALPADVWALSLMDQILGTQERAEDTVVADTSTNPWTGFPDPAAGDSSSDPETPAPDQALPSSMSSGEARMAALGDTGSLRPEPLLEERLRLQRMEEALRLRQVAVSMSEERVKSAIAQLTALQGEVQAALDLLEEQATSDLAGLVDVYIKMKPKDAARIFDDLGQEELLYFTRHIPPKSLGPIFAKMQVDRVAAVTAIIAGDAKRFIRDAPEPAQR